MTSLNPPVDPREDYQRMVSEIADVVHRQDQQYLADMGNAGLIDQYMQQRMASTDMAKTQEQVSAMREALPFMDTGSPHAGQALGQWMDELQGQVGQDPGLLQGIADLRGDVDFYRAHGQSIEESKGAIERRLNQLIGYYSNEGSVSKAITNVAQGIGRGLMLDSLGSPEEELMRALQEGIEGGVERYRGVPGHEKRFDDQMLRDTLLTHGMSVLQGMPERGLSESFVDELTRKAGGLAGFMGPMVAGGGAGGFLGGVAKGMGAGAKTSRLVAGAGTAGTLGLAAGMKDAHPLQKMALDDAVREGRLKPEQRDEALESARIYNSMAMAVMVPAFTIAGPVGRVFSLGLGKKFPWLGSAAGLPATMELAQGGVDFARTIAEQAGSETAAQSFLASPRIAGALEQLITAEDGDAAVEAAKHYAKEVLPALPVFGAIHALQATRPNLITDRLKAAARGEFEAFIRGDKAATKVATKVIDELGPAKREPGAAAKMAKERGREPAEKAIREEQAAARVRRADRKSPEPEKEQPGRAAELDREADILQEQARTMFDVAEGSGRRSVLEAQAEALLDRAEGYRRSAANAREGKPLELPEGDTFLKQLDVEGPKRRLRENVEGEQLRDQAAEAVVRREQSDQGQREAVQTRFGELRDAVEGAQGAKQKQSAIRKGVRWATSSLRPGDVIQHPLGDVTVTSIKQHRGRWIFRGTRDGDLVRGPISAIFRDPSTLKVARRVGRRSAKEKAPPVEAEATEASKALDAGAEVLEAKTPKQRAEASQRALEATKAAKVSEGQAMVRARQPSAREPEPPQYRQRPNGEAVVEGVGDPHRLGPDEQAVQAKAQEWGERLRAGGKLEPFARMKGPRRDAALAEITKGRGPEAEWARFAQEHADRYSKMKGEDFIAESVWDYGFRSLHGEEAPYRITPRIRQLFGELQNIAKIRDRSEAARNFLQWAEANRVFLAGELAVFARFHPKGIELFRSIESVQGHLFGPQGAMAMGGLGLMPRMFPWVDSWVRSEAGLLRGAWGGGAERIVSMLDGMLHQLYREPDTQLSGMARAGLGRFEMPVNWAGRLATDRTRTVSTIHHEGKRLYDTFLHPRKGLFGRSGIKPWSAESRALFDAMEAGPSSPLWAALSPEHQSLARTTRNILREIWAKHMEHSPRVRAMLEAIEIQKRREAAAKEAADRFDAMEGDAVKGLRTRARNRLRSIRSQLTQLENLVQEMRDTQGIENYMHHANQELYGPGAHRGHAYAQGDRASPSDRVTAGALRRRTGSLAESGRVARDVYASLAEYFRQMLPVVHLNAFYGRHSNFLYGKKVPATAALLAGPEGPRPTAYFQGMDWKNHGYYWVSKDGVQKVKDPADRPEGAKMMLALSNYADMGKAYTPDSAGPSMNAKWIGEAVKTARRGDVIELQHHSLGAVRLVEHGRVATDVLVRDGGFMQMRNNERRQDMRAFLDELSGRLRSGETGVFGTRGRLRELGVLSNEMFTGAFSIGTAMNALAGAAVLNLGVMGINPWTHGVVTGKMLQAFTRHMRARRAMRDPANVQMERTVEGEQMPSFDIGIARAMRTPESKLRRMTEDQRREQSIWDDAFEDMARSPIFQGRIADMAESLGRPGEASAPQEIKGKLKAGVRRVRNQGFMFMQGVEGVVRSQAYLATYYAYRKAGRSRREAQAGGEGAVIHAHGMFNAMSTSAFQKSWMGPWAGGIQTWASHFFGMWLRSPPEYKMRVAKVGITAMVAASMLGLGDYTNTVGFSAYDVLPPLEELVRGHSEGTVFEEWSKTGFIPVPMPAELIGLPLSVVGGDRPPRGTPAVAGVRNVAKATGQAMAGDLQEAGRSALSASQAFVPSIANQINKAYFSPKLPSGKFQVYGLTMGGHKDRPSYQLNQDGIQQLLLDWAPGMQTEVADQIYSWKMAKARDRIMSGKRSNIRDRAVTMLETMDQARATQQQTGVAMSEQETAAWREKWSGLTKEARGVGLRLNPRELRKTMRLRQLPLGLRSVVTAGSKAAKVDALSDALSSEDWKISTDELRQVMRLLAGRKPFRQWLAGPEVPSSSRARFAQSYRAWASSQQP